MKEKICSKCGSIIKETQKTIKIKELGIECEVNIHDKDKKLGDIKIPEGWRLLKANEIIFLHNNKKYRKSLNMEDTWEFIEQPFELNKKKGYLARFYALSDWANLNCYRYPEYSDASLGVRFCRDYKGGSKRNF